MTIEWRIFYADGSTFSNENGAPFDATPSGVQIIVIHEPEIGRYILAKKDFYWWDNARGRWFGGDQGGFYQYMLLRKGPKYVVFGEYIANSEYKQILHRALTDAEFLPKSAKWPEEDYE